MTKKLVILRNERASYEVHVEMGNPPEKRVGGLSLDDARLTTELKQHGCPAEMIDQIFHEIESRGSATVSL